MRPDAEARAREAARAIFALAARGRVAAMQADVPFDRAPLDRLEARAIRLVLIGMIGAPNAP